jgi:hypothetical protein
MSRLREALDQIDFARRYTRERIETVPSSEWFTIPPGGVTNLAWQVAHLARSEYRLCLVRLRPRTTADAELISDEVLELFATNTVPTSPSNFLSAADIRSVFDRVHDRVMNELANYPDAELDLPPLEPHPYLPTRIAALRYAPLHEMIHCGQIALIRRMLGYPPIW